MTITAVLADGRFWCVWFIEVDGVIRPKGEAYKADALVPTDELPPVFIKR